MKGLVTPVLENDLAVAYSYPSVDACFPRSTTQSGTKH